MTLSHSITFCAAAMLACSALVGCSGKRPPADQATAAPANATGANITAAETRGKNVCLQVAEIDHTTIPNDSTILFHLKGGKIWKNTLPFPCPDLKFQGGFQYTTSIDMICSNLQTIRVINQGGGGPFFGAVCQLGEFTPYTPPPKPRSG